MHFFCLFIRMRRGTNDTETIWKFVIKMFCFIGCHLVGDFFGPLAVTRTSAQRLESRLDAIMRRRAGPLEKAFLLHQCATQRTLRRRRLESAEPLWNSLASAAWFVRVHSIIRSFLSLSVSHIPRFGSSSFHDKQIHKMRTERERGEKTPSIKFWVSIVVSRWGQGYSSFPMWN